jgi:hypothetical protein
MKTIKLLILSFLLIGNIKNQLNAQSILNPDFEQTDTTNSFAFISDWEGDGFGGAPSTLSQSGNYSMMIWNWYWYGRAYAYNGNNAGLGSTFAYKGGTPYTQKAMKLNGYYRYDTSYTQTNADTAIVAVLLKKYNTSLSKVDTIGYGITYLTSYSPSDNSFAPFEVIINDLQPGIQPDSIVVFMQSSLNGFCAMSTAGECLYLNIDNLSLETPLGITDVKGNKIVPKIFPNPTNNDFSIKFTADEISSVKIYSITGNLVHQLTQHDSPLLNISLNNFDEGMYLVEITDSKGNTYTDRLVKN